MSIFKCKTVGRHHLVACDQRKVSSFISHIGDINEDISRFKKVTEYGIAVRKHGGVVEGTLHLK